MSHQPNACSSRNARLLSSADPSPALSRRGAYSRTLGSQHKRSAFRLRAEGKYLALRHIPRTQRWAYTRRSPLVHGFDFDVIDAPGHGVVRTQAHDLRPENIVWHNLNLYLVDVHELPQIPVGRLSLAIKSMVSSQRRAEQK